MEKTERNPYRLAPTVGALLVSALLVSALVSVLGRGVSTSCVIPRRGPFGKAYDREQFWKANDNHGTLHKP